MRFKTALINNVLWKLGGLVFVFLINLLIVRLLGSEESGNFFYIIALLTVFIMGFRLGLDNGITLLATKYPKATNGLLFFIIPFALIQYELVILILKQLPRIYNAFATKIAALFVVMNTVQYYISAFYMSRKMFKSLNVINTVFQFLQFVVIGFLYIKYSGKQFSLVWMGQLLLEVLAYLMLFQIMFSILYYYIMNRREYFTINLKTSALRALFGYSWVMYLVTIIMYLIIRADFYFVKVHSSSSELSNYVQAAKIGQMLMVVPGFIGGVIFPYAINSGRDFVHKLMIICKMVGLLYIGFFALAALGGNVLFTWLFGSEFSLMNKTMLFMAPGILAASINQILVSFFEGKNKPTFILIVYSINLAILLAGYLLLVPRYGYNMAAMVFSIGNVLTMIMLTFLFKNESRIPLRNFLIFTPGEKQLLRNFLS